jgi:hypothetical protein
MEKSKKSIINEDPVYHQLILGLKHSLKYISKFLDKEQVPVIEEEDAVIRIDGSFKVVSRTLKDYSNLVGDHRSSVTSIRTR